MSITCAAPWRSPGGWNPSAIPRSVSSTLTSHWTWAGTWSRLAGRPDDGDEYASTPKAAQVVAQLHQLTAPEELGLPPLEPFANAAERISDSTWLNPDDRSFLTSTPAELQDAHDGLEFTLQRGVIHGDASVRNVLRDSHGNPVLIDLDGFAIGPREWDLVLIALCC